MDTIFLLPDTTSTQQTIAPSPSSSSSSSSHSSTMPTPRSASSSTSSLSPPDPTISCPLTPPEYPFSHSSHHILSLDYYDSPPSPPTTLEDQMQVAYALDNMHLAKILLLKLKGIQVTDDNDPRIAQVKDEDFASSFMPNGGIILDEETERKCQEADRRERERKRMRQREERLRVCERIWDASTRSLRQEKARVAKKKEDESRERRRLHIAARATQSDPRIKHDLGTVHNDNQLLLSTAVRTSLPPSLRLHHHRPVLSYGSLPTPPSRVSYSPPTPNTLPASTRRPDSPTFQYPVMPPPPRTLSSSRPSSPPSLIHHKKSSPSSSSSSSLSSPHRTLMELSSQSVPFAAVVMSMYGPLFPPVASEEDEPSTRSLCPKTRRRRSVRQMQLLQDLLARQCWQEVPETSNAGDGSTSSRNSSLTNDKTRSVLTLSPTNSLASSSSNTLTTRSVTYSSWFSFTSRSTRTTTTTRSSRTTSTVLTLPSLSSQSLPPHSQTKDIAPNVVSPSSSSRCNLGLRVERVLVEMDEDPLRPLSRRSSLAFSSTPASTSSVSSYRSTNGRTSLRTRSSRIAFPSSPSPSTVPIGKDLVQKMNRSVSTIMHMATQFQSAYVKATMFSAGSDLYSSHIYSPSSSSRGDTSRLRVEKKARWGGSEVGYRVESEDVRVFISGTVLEGVAFSAGIRSTSSSSSSLSATTPSSLPELPPSRNPNRVVDEDDIVASGHRRLRPLIPLVPASSFSSYLSSPSSSTSPYSSRGRPIRPRIIPLPLPIPRSPFRPPYAPAQLTVRLRPVANPLVLRLRAVQNVCEGYGLIYDGHSGGHLGEGSLQTHSHMHIQPLDTRSMRGVREVLCGGGQLGGCGGGHVWKEREKVVGVAWEGIGRSRLGWEVGVC